MFEIAENPTIASLTDSIDELSTRLIIDGVASLSQDDFESFSEAAAGAGCMHLARAAKRLAAGIAPSTYAIPERTRLLSCGLVELKKLLDDPNADSDDSVEATPECASAVRAEAAEARSLMPEVNPLAADEGLRLYQAHLRPSRHPRRQLSHAPPHGGKLDGAARGGPVRSGTDSRP